MICVYCQGRKRYKIGPQDHDERDCRYCTGVGDLWPKSSVQLEFPIGEVTGFKPSFTPPSIAYTTQVGMAGPEFAVPDNIYQSLSTMIEEAEAIAKAHRANMIDKLKAAELSGVRVIPDHRVKGDDLTILVSPELYQRLKDS